MSAQISTYTGAMPGRVRRIPEMLSIAIEQAIEASASTGESKIITGLADAVEVKRVAARLRQLASQKRLSMSVFVKPEECSVVFRINLKEEQKVAVPEPAPVRKRTSKKAVTPKARAAK